MNGEAAIVARVVSVSHRYGRTAALEGIDLTIPAGGFIGLIGPDGVGKSTLLGLLAGAKQVQGGRIQVLDGDIARSAHRRAVCPRIAYMPQGLGKNLYPDLSVRENIEFFAQLFGQNRAERTRRIAELLDATGLAPFPDRPAKKLSGGMRQKLGLCCALVHDPDLLILDEPTTGVDPLSRRQFWQLIARMRAARPAMTIIVATAYMEEAERFDWLVAMNAGRILATATPNELKACTGRQTLEESFIALLPEEHTSGRRALAIPPRATDGREPAIVARHLSCRFGEFLAVNDVSFSIERGEIFGFLGSNGCGKTTTMKMLTGLLPASSGEVRLFDQPIEAGGMALRSRVGYMSQSFSLYTELTVRQNLDLHARLFHLPRERARQRIADLVRQFRLGEHVDVGAAALPLGIRQRLSLAVAVVHEPELLILDEPTSGVDPLARDLFWELLVDLSRNRGVTIFVSTHFMNEATRCDRISLMHAGRVLATGTPEELVRSRSAATLEDAFIDYLEAATGERRTIDAVAMPRAAAQTSTRARSGVFSVSRLLAYAIRETLELRRDPVRLAFALFGTVFLMIVFGFGINTDVEHLPFAALDRDQTPESRAYLEELTGSAYFTARAPLGSYAELERRLAGGELKLAIEIPPGFGRDLRRGYPTEIGAWVDGAMPFRAETTRGYLQGVHRHFLAGWAASQGLPSDPPAPASIVARFRYNQDFKSVYAMVPGTIALLLALIPAILMALAVVREKELGSITNLYVTPVTRLEFILGKQLPFIALTLGAIAYVTATTGYGFVISAFASTQIAALFGTAILTFLPAMQFSGMLTPVSSLTGLAAILGRGFPMSYFLPISVGTFTKSLGLAELGPGIAALALFAPALLGLSLAQLRKQER